MTADGLTARVGIEENPTKSSATTIDHVRARFI
jgi:hypothetical protein